MRHRGLLHHQIVVVADLARSAAFYGPVLTDWGYELAGASARFQDWRRWDLDTPHELSIVQVDPALASVRHRRGAVGHHHHLAFAAADRADVDRFHRDVLVPLAARGLGRILDAPDDCPEYGEGYYATFFEDPDGLRLEFVVNEGFWREQAARGARTD